GRRRQAQRRPSLSRLAAPFKHCGLDPRRAPCTAVIAAPRNGSCVELGTTTSHILCSRRERTRAEKDRSPRERFWPWAILADRVACREHWGTHSPVIQMVDVPHT